MVDYFKEYSTLAGNRLPSPADTPYDTPGYLRSKRSSRAGSSREQSSTPPPLPSHSNDTLDDSREGQYSAVDPRRFTPTLHASLVSEILNLRREIDSKNNLVENLETALSQTRDDNDSLAARLLESAKEVRKAKLQVEQLEKGTLDAVEDLAKERDAAKSAFHEIRSKFEVTQKKTRVQDDDAVRAQTIWESEKESWDNERRQLERRIHVTESRLRAVLDEMASQQNQAMQSGEAGGESAFKDSGMDDAEGSDTASIRSAVPASPVKHKRNMSSTSFRPRDARASVSSRGTAATPDLYCRSGNTLADELGIDEEDEYDDDEYESGELELDGPTSAQRAVESRQSLRKHEVAAAADGAPDPSATGIITVDDPENQEFHHSIVQPMFEASSSASQVRYVDSGYQPSPPPSPPRVEIAHHDVDTFSTAVVRPTDCVRLANFDSSSEQPRSTSGLRTRVESSPISPPQTPVVDDGAWPAGRRATGVAPLYRTASTQTELVEQQMQPGRTPQQDSLSPHIFVPSIAIHPPSSRPSSPRPYALPPGTKNAASQANINCAYKDAGMQTAEIRVDQRPVKLAAHLLPSHLLPSPTLSETALRPKRAVPADLQKTLAKSISVTSPPAPVPFHVPIDLSTDMSKIAKDLRTYPLKAISLPRPVLSPLASPALPQSDSHNSNGPLNRSSQYGVSQSRLDSQPLADEFDPCSAHSDYEGRVNDFEVDFANAIPGLSRPPPGRFGLSEPPKAVPEDKEISPERRPDTAGSARHVPGSSIPSSRPSSQSRQLRQNPKSAKPDARRDPRSRSPSFGSMASSSQSAPTGATAPPFPIPLRRSSRIVMKPRSDGSQSPLSYDLSGKRSRTGPNGHARQVSLRKVQSAAIIRTRTGRVSPQKGHRQRRRTPDLTPVQSMAFEDPPMPTDFPIPDLPTPLQDTLKYVQGSVDMSATTGSAPRPSEETNLVDAIAGTMVGEWMWKYIRKRKSFGIGEDNDLPVADQNGFMSSTGHGTRHKRWVWLSPYERTIMWDSKQPTSGPALLGKKGRKLSIQSVLDVQDLTALPKNPELGEAWKRSILILTPERALKFTATSQERHRLWMAALTFLAESQSHSQSRRELNSIPQTIKAPPPDPSTSLDGVSIKRHRAPSFGKSTVRDSIRLAKGKKLESSKRADTNYESGREDGADFPSVPRLYITTSKHQRKRSYTNPGIQVPSEKFRSLTSSAIQSSYGGSTNGSSYRPSASSKSGSRRDSIASPDRPNFFEAVGTVRMEAFVDPNVRDGVLYVPAPPPTISGAPRRRRHERDLSQSTVDKRRAGYVFDGDDDPFHGF